MRTGFNATKLAIAAFLIPYIFCLNPSMLLIDTTAAAFLQIILTSFIGMAAIAAAVEGYLLRPIRPLLRLLLALSGLLMLYPGALTDALGVGAVAAVFGAEYVRNRRAARQAA